MQCPMDCSWIAFGKSSPVNGKQHMFFDTLAKNMIHVQRTKHKGSLSYLDLAMLNGLGTEAFALQVAPKSNL